MKKICIIGSLNMDLVTTVERFPKPGETITGCEFRTSPGGKGANQAVAAGRLRGDVVLIGKIGGDIFGRQLLNNLKENGVKTEGLEIEPETSSGIAAIEVDGTGENHIIIIPGANDKVNKALIDKRLDFILENDIFLLQLEIPLETVVYAVKKLKEYGKTVILDPAPVKVLPVDLYGAIDYITPNETEVAMLTGRDVRTKEDLSEAVKELHKKGVPNVILKAGSDGAYIFENEHINHIKGFSVTVADTIGAGDSFNAGLAVSLAQGRGLVESVVFANAVGALSTTAKGAQSAMPTYEQVRSFMDLYEK